MVKRAKIIECEVSYVIMLNAQWKWACAITFDSCGKLFVNLQRRGDLLLGSLHLRFDDIGVIDESFD